LEQFMATSKEDLVSLNQNQTHSEVDPFTLERYTQFTKHFPKITNDILDIGCNTGRGGALMKSLLPSVNIVGLDVVPERLALIDPAVYKATLCGFADSIDAPSGSFDAVVAGEIIEHIPGNAIFPSLCEIFRVLRLRGRILLTTPNPRSLKNRKDGLSVLMDPSHVSQHTRASMRRKLEDAGFSSIKICGSGRMTRYLGEHAPIANLYGSYLAVAEKW
jgi:SAM-dependent methyltransferase